MLISAISRIVSACVRHAKTVVVVALLLGIACSFYAARHFAINTDINTLISPDLDWRKRETAFADAFPSHFGSALAVVDAPTPELAAQAASALTAKLSNRPNLFHSVEEAGGGTFFRRNGLLFQPEQELSATAQNLGRASPLISALASDPSLRGLTQALSFGLGGVQRGLVKLDAMAPTLNAAADTVDQGLAGKPPIFSWNVLLKGKPAEPSDLLRFVDTQPVLDFSALEPGKNATDAIRKTAADLQLQSKYMARVRLTGPIPIADEEFSTVQDGALVNGLATVVIVLVILWLALKSGRIIFAVFVNLIVGLAITAALGLWMVGALNLISIAFAVLFVGLGVDFAIQFAVRYRAERFQADDLHTALVNAARRIGAPLTLAAAAVAAGFLSFLPTDYRGVSELGQIAGGGMVVAFLTSITFLPALLKILNPAGEPAEVGYKVLAPVDDFLARQRFAVIGGTLLVAIVGLPLLYWLTFDFNPINLRSPKVESIATFLELRNDPNIGANSIYVLTPSVADAAKAAAALAKLPEVARVMTLRSFIPDNQDQKLATIQALAKQLESPLHPRTPAAPPNDATNIAALNSAAAFLTRVAGTTTGVGADAAKRLAASLTRLAGANPSVREKVQAAFVSPLKTDLAQLEDLLKAEPVTEKNLPPTLIRDWVTPEGMARVEAQPKGDPNDNETLRRFARAVLAVNPTATGGPISILESGHTIVFAFVQAGITALISIAILLWIVLRRIGDVLLTLVPLLLAGVVTLEICVIIGLPLNFANIIALPLLLGVGVAFKIYYIMAWRNGQTNLLQSSLTRAVIWSALCTATAFGSLWLSSHPGTSSMGKLLALSLMTTLCAAVLFQPALMGKPREAENADRKPRGASEAAS